MTDDKAALPTPVDLSFDDNKSSSSETSALITLSNRIARQLLWTIEQ